MFEERFERFWKEYPRKVGKGAAKKVFLKLKPSEALTETMLAAVVKQRQCEQWRKENGQYIPNPATWLSQGRWEDEVKEDKNAGSEFDYEEYAKGVGLYIS